MNGHRYLKKQRTFLIKSSYFVWQNWKHFRYFENVEIGQNCLSTILFRDPAQSFNTMLCTFEMFFLEYNNFCGKPFSFQKNIPFIVTIFRWPRDFSNDKLTHWNEGWFLQHFFVLFSNQLHLKASANVALM